MLKDWVRAEAASAEQYRDTRRRARRWAAGEAGFWEGTDLDIGLAWRDRERPNASWAERYGGNFALAMRFLDESRAHRDAAEAERRNIRRRQQRRERTFLMAGWALLVVVAIFGTLFWRASTRAANIIRGTNEVLNTAAQLSRPAAHLQPDTSDKLSKEIGNLQAELLDGDATSQSLLHGIAVYVLQSQKNYLGKRLFNKEKTLQIRLEKYS